MNFKLRLPPITIIQIDGLAAFQERCRMKSLSVFTLLFLSIISLPAEVSVSGLFSDHMVLQRNQPVPIWGEAADGEVVTVRFGKQQKKTKAENGKWMVRLDSLKAGGPHELTIQGENTLTFTNVLVGEVWICSGQSNMEWPLSRSEKPEAAIEGSANSQIRLLTVPKRKELKPVSDVKAKWVECSPKTTPGFSAVAYYFGRDLQKALKVPIGLIHTSWGGSPAEVWIREDFLAANLEYKSDVLDPYLAQEKRSKEAIAAWEKEDAELKKDGKKITRARPGTGWRPAELYNGMIAPLIPYAIKGGIWYQGESNAGKAEQYRRLFADLIRNWRQDWNQREFPFLLVQLAPWDKSRKRSLTEITAAPVESDWAELREAQTMTTTALPKVGMAVITDAGDKDDIHPAKKEPVGSRLALAARRIAYNQKIIHSGPTYKSMKVDGNRVVLSFENVGKGLESRDGKLTGFAVAGEDKKFVWADAAIQGNKVVVSSPQVEKPVAVRYGWADFPVVNLYNREGLPAVPFRTDDFPMVTKKK